jgi:hypothetical protein
MRWGRRNIFLLVALTATMWIVVAGGPADAGTAVAHAAAAAPLVSYERTGGLAGVDDVVDVSGSGAVIVRHRDGDVHRTRLGVRRLRALRRAIRAAHFERPVRTHPTNCDDCFSYRLRHGGHTLSFSQLAAPARVDGVLRILAPLAERH